MRDWRKDEEQGRVFGAPPVPARKSAESCSSLLKIVWVGRATRRGDPGVFRGGGSALGSGADARQSWHWPDNRATHCRSGFGMARHGSDGKLWGRSSDGALGVSRVGWRASFGCNGLWAPTYTPKCDTSETKLRHERNATATRAKRNCDTSATQLRRMGDGRATVRARLRDGCATDARLMGHARDAHTRRAGLT